MQHAGDDRRGLIFGLGAFGFWGLLPLYFWLIADVGAFEIVAQRVLWSVVLLVPIVFLLGKRPSLIAALRNPRAMGMLTVSAVLIATNWLIYIWSVVNGQVLASSLAYFLNPLLNIVIGVVLLGERLTRSQAAAVVLAGAGVAVLAVGAGSGLWISLVLAFSFAFYGLIRKLAPVESLEGLTIETLLLAPFAVGYIVWVMQAGTLAFGQDGGTTALLVLAGAATTTPLLLFAAAARRLRMASLGVLQFLAPSIQFVLAITVFGESLSTERFLCFGLIWAGLGVYVAGTLVDGRRRQRLAAAPAAE